MVNQYIIANSPNEDTEEAPVKTYKGVCCQVCVFEGRKTRTKSVAFCGKHGIRACLTTPNLFSYGNEKFKNAVEASTETELAMWRCPNVSESCWRKAHSFYIVKGLWGQESKLPGSNDHHKTFRHHGVKVSSILYKNREDWMLKHNLISKKGGTRGRKSTKRQTTSTGAEETSSTTKRKRRRQNHEKPPAACTTIDTVRVSGNMGNETHNHNLSSDDDEEGDDSVLRQARTQQVSV